MVGDPGSPVGALVGLALVFGVVVFCALVVVPAWRRLRAAWRELNRPLR